MARRTREQIVSDLEGQGFRFRTFSIVHDSPHAIVDWDWNQRDLPHVPFVHGGFRMVHAAAEDGLAVGIYVQRVLGVRVPMTVSFHHLEGLAPRARLRGGARPAGAGQLGADLAEVPSGDARVDGVQRRQPAGDALPPPDRRAGPPPQLPARPRRGRSLSASAAARSAPGATASPPSAEGGSLRPVSSISAAPTSSPLRPR